jgi:hypothetical protein
MRWMMCKSKVVRFKVGVWRMQKAMPDHAVAQGSGR